jgi:hypothetical protein
MQTVPNPFTDHSAHFARPFERAPEHDDSQR